MSIRPYGVTSASLSWRTPPPLAGRPPWLADPPYMTDGWGARPLRWLSVLVCCFARSVIDFDEMAAGLNKRRMIQSAVYKELVKVPLQICSGQDQGLKKEMLQLFFLRGQAFRLERLSGRTVQFNASTTSIFSWLILVWRHGPRSKDETTWSCLLVCKAAGKPRRVQRYVPLNGTARRVHTSVRLCFGGCCSGSLLFVQFLARGLHTSSACSSRITTKSGDGRRVWFVQTHSVLERLIRSNRTPQKPGFLSMAGKGFDFSICQLFHKIKYLRSVFVARFQLPQKVVEMWQLWHSLQLHRNRPRRYCCRWSRQI